jgi:NAD(P)-dependent dehydrogenase (short-subunit alcohol dehydrogenase family)
MSDKKKILITGASAGFGFDTAKALAQRGHTVYATMRGVAGKNEENAANLRAWAESGGLDLHVIELDVTDTKSVEAAVAKTNELGGIDVLINNAGFGNFNIDEGYSTEQAQAIFDVNLFGVMRVNRAVLPGMRAAGSGLIIYVSSGLGRFVLPFMAIYNSSKFALEGYAETINYEVEPLGIQSVIVQPGAFGTTFLGNTLQPDKDVVAGYGPTAATLETFGGNFEAAAKAGKLPDPIAVVNALVEEVERPAGDRPLRRPVGDDVSGPVGAINQAAQVAQGELHKAFGLG